METSNEKTTGALVHLSTLTQYFIPFGNFIFPIVIWSTSKKNSGYIDHHGKQAINFQLSLFLYSLILLIISIPVLIFTVFKNIPKNAIINNNEFILNDFSLENITGMVVVALTALLILCALKTAEFFLIIYATIKASSGEKYKYPLTINFIGTKDENSSNEAEPEIATAES